MAKPFKILKVDDEVHQQVTELAQWLGVQPGQVVADAVTFYLDNERDNLTARAQERLADLFNKLDKAKSNAATGWGLPNGGWGS